MRIQKILCLLASGLLFAAPLLAEGTASHSLSSLRGYDNPAINGFKKNSLQVIMGQRDQKMDLGTNQMGNYDATGRFGAFFYGLENGYSKIAGKTANYSGFSVGWALQDWNFAYSQFTTKDEIAITITPAYGITYMLTNNMILGYTVDDSGSLGHSSGYGVAFRTAGFRVEYDSNDFVKGAGGHRSKSSGELEFSWGQMILGYQTSRLLDAGVSKASENTYLGWEPAKGGFSYLIESFSGNYNPKSDLKLSVGYLF